MTTVQCPLCGLRFTYRSEFEVHAREDHVHRSFHRHRDPEAPLPVPRETDDTELSAGAGSSAPS